MRIAQIANNWGKFDPETGIGIAAVIRDVSLGLSAKGNDVTVFVPNGSVFPGIKLRCVGKSFEELGINLFHPDAPGAQAAYIKEIVSQLHDFDIIHSHAEHVLLPFIDDISIPVVSTIHGAGFMPREKAIFQSYPNAIFIALSEGAKRALPYIRFSYVVHNGIRFDETVYNPNPSSMSCLIWMGRFSENKGVLLTLDDLTTHAKFYREISLLGKRFPGRNSYPGDIFYTHAKLLERAGNFVTQKGEKAITCLPVVETAQGDLSGYIQTNVMSMTDGHLYFDSDLFAKGRRPAINPFLSVTRVGRQTQSTLKRDINREILSFLTISEKMQNFTHFGAELTESTKVTLAVGEKVIKFLDQESANTMPINLQLLLFSMLWDNILQNKNIEPIGKDIDNIIESYKNKLSISKEIDQTIENTRSFNDFLKTMREKGERLLSSLKS